MCNMYVDAHCCMCTGMHVCESVCMCVRAHVDIQDGCH